jgi:hypothetical protein
MECGRMRVIKKPANKIQIKYRGGGESTSSKVSESVMLRRKKVISSSGIKIGKIRF